MSAATATKPKTKRGRGPGRPPKEYDWAALLPRIVAEIATKKHRSPTAACGVLNIAPRRFFAHMAEDEGFCAAIEIAKARRLAFLEERLLTHSELPSSERGAIGGFIFILTTAAGMNEYNRPKGVHAGDVEPGDSGASDDALPLAHNDMSEIRERALVNTVTKRAIAAVLETLKGRTASEVDAFIRSIPGVLAPRDDAASGANGDSGAHG